MIRDSPSFPQSNSARHISHHCPSSGTQGQTAATTSLISMTSRFKNKSLFQLYMIDLMFTSRCVKKSNANTQARADCSSSWLWRPKPEISLGSRLAEIQIPDFCVSQVRCGIRQLAVYRRVQLKYGVCDWKNYLWSWSQMDPTLLQARTWTKRPLANRQWAHK